MSFILFMYQAWIDTLRYLSTDFGIDAFKMLLVLVGLPALALMGVVALIGIVFDLIEDFTRN